MKARRLVLSVALALVLSLAACQSAQPAPTATPTASTTGAQTGATATLDLVGPAGSKTLTLDDVRALPAVQGWAGIKNSVGKITQPALHKGVALKELCNLVGGAGPEDAIEVTAKDGYATTLSYDEAIKGDLITYDPISGDEIKIGDPLQVILAYERDGQPLPEDSDGSLRLAVISPRNNQVTDGHWAVKWVVKIAVKPVTE
jgi:DMSO/TMAO reductase YedYZ molybdopterin-dependent catalytic subunit